MATMKEEKQGRKHTDVDTGKEGSLSSFREKYTGRAAWANRMEGSQNIQSRTTI